MDPRPLRWLRMTLPIVSRLHGVEDERVDAVRLWLVEVGRGGDN